ncbi:hypothetical protein C8R44DRAFT_984314 [Mycena epipterygia]|nr:hypothetical protein C8R44DRAFT_984314 [Mycena epipterygia]
MSSPSTAPESSAPPQIILDADGTAVCPECQKRVPCGPSGIQNLIKQHMGSKICRTAKAKLAKLSNAEKPLKQGSLFGFLRAKPVRVSSTVVAPGNVKLVAPSAKMIPRSSSPLRESSQPSGSSAPRVSTSSALLTQLEAAIRSLPSTVVEATETDVLAAFVGDPATYVDPKLAAIEIFEHLNPLFHFALGWNMPVEETAQILRRGEMGLDGLWEFFRYFIEERGVREQDFGVKIQQILDAIKFLNSTSYDIAPTDFLAPSAASPDVSYEPECASDDIEIVYHLPAPIPFSHACEGFVFPLREGQTISTAYPILLHDHFNLSWDYAVRRGVLYLTAHTCTGKQWAGKTNCTPCADLPKNDMLKGVISRSEEGVHENANLMFLPPAALAEIVRQKNIQIQGLRLGLLTNSRNLLTQAASLSDYKRFVVAIGSNKVQRVDRVVGACIKQKRGLRGMFDAYLRAAKGVYHPANDEEEDMLGSLIMQLGGIRVAEIAHRALGLPGITTLRNRMLTPLLTASPGAPRVEEIQKNIDACFAGIADALVAKKVVHQIVMLDEIAVEKRIRWDPTTNHFLGVCRQHGHHVGLEFNGESDLEELLNALAKKVNAKGKEESLMHAAAEATVAAVGIMSEDTRLYAARPILISADCKRESGEEHEKKVLDPIMRALDDKKEVTRLRTICLASDGETRRGTAFVKKTFKHQLPTTSNIYPLLKDLKFMKFMVGDDDLTADKDVKHVDKRLRNRFLGERGIKIRGLELRPAILRTHFQSAGHSAEHIRSVFNPEDKQDVGLAFEMLKDIWSLPPCPAGTNPGVAAARDALRTLGKLLYHFVFPYICVDFSLSEQLEHLSAAAHLALVLFRLDGKDFMASLLYTDIMIIIKNLFFCVAKAKVDDPLEKFWLILLGTDRLEELFGLIRTMIGNDANCDLLQLKDRLRGTTEVSTILAKYPHWDRGPRRLRLPAMTREFTQLPDRVDHIKPASVRGDMRVQQATPLTCWNRGRRMIENDCPWAVDILKTLDATPGIDILNPFGKLSFDDLDADEDDETDITSGSTIPAHPLSTELEDAAEEELNAVDSGSQMRTPTTFSHSITMGGQSVRKARALSQRLKYGSQKTSTDRTRRVAGIARHSVTSAIDSGIVQFDSVFGGPCLMISDVVATLVRCENRIFLCLGEVNGIYLNSESLDSLGLDVLPEKTVAVSFQLLKIIPATTIDDISNKHDWKSAGLLGQTLKVFGCLIQPLDPSLSTAQIGCPNYLFESAALRILTASLFEQLTPQKHLALPTGAGRACFVCEFDNNSREIESANTCPACPPNTPLDPRQGQQVLAHMAAHILCDPNIDRSTEPCGICLNPAPMCEWYLTTSGKKKINNKRSKCPHAAILFRYSTAANSTASSPSSNIPINCALCGIGQPASWRYNYLHHLQTVHPAAPVEKYASIWRLHPDEIERIKKVWKAHERGVPIPKKRESTNPSLVISEAHSSRLSMRATAGTSSQFIDDSELPAVAEDSDEESAQQTCSEDDDDYGMRDKTPLVLDTPMEDDNIRFPQSETGEAPQTIETSLFTAVVSSFDEMPDPNMLSIPSTTVGAGAVSVPEFGRGYEDLRQDMQLFSLVKMLLFVDTNSFKR